MRSAVVAMAVAAVLSAPVARAAEAERPWARGVPQPQQERALELFKEANGKLRDAKYAEASDQYLEALRAWDHPAIHYNLALALLNLDRPVEAYQHLVQALKYGAAPLDADRHEQGLRYKALLEKQLVDLTVRCQLQDAVIRLDGQQLFIGPGVWEGMVRAGPHSIVGSKPGYVPVERAETLVGGDAKEVELSLFRTEELTEYRRRWTPVLDWSLLGGGALALGGGIGLRFAAEGTYAAYDAQVKTCASDVSRGCTPSSGVTALRIQGDALQAVSITAMVVGGAALVAGGVLAYLNRPQPFIRSVSVSLLVRPPPVPGGPPATLLALGWRP